jgi:hypothetical protein
MFFHLLTVEAYTCSKLAYTPCLFALPAYLAQTGEAVYIFVVENEEGALEGIAPFVLREHIAYSPPRATFGGWYGNILPTEVQGKFWNWVKEELTTLGAHTLHVKLPPLAHFSVFPPFQPSAFLTFPDLNYHLDLSEDFIGKLHHSEKRRLKKAHNVGLKASHWTNPDLLEVYQFIAEARQRKGFPITLTYEQFAQNFQNFPTHYEVFTVRDLVGKLACLTVTVKLSEAILYNFYPADSSAYLTYSPMVLLLEFVTGWAKKQGFQLFDLGIATVEGVRNEGLIRFKKNLGAIETPKYTCVEML